MKKLILSEFFDHVEYNRIFDELYEPLCRYSYRYVYSSEVAEDVVQETFTNLWLNWERLSKIESLKSYLYTSVKNNSVREMKRNYFRTNSLNIEDYEHTVSEAQQTTAQQSMEYDELLLIVEKALERLPKKCRAIFVLKRFDGKTNKEIAELLSISVKTVEAQMTIAIKKLSEAIRQLYPEKSLFLLYIFFRRFN